MNVFLLLQSLKSEGVFPLLSGDFEINPFCVKGAKSLYMAWRQYHDHGLHLGLVKIILGNVLYLECLYFRILAENISWKRGNYLNLILEMGKLREM